MPLEKQVFQPTLVSTMPRSPIVPHYYEIEADEPSEKGIRRRLLQLPGITHTPVLRDTADSNHQVDEEAETILRNVLPEVLQVDAEKPVFFLVPQDIGILKSICPRAVLGYKLLVNLLGIGNAD